MPVCPRCGKKTPKTLENKCIWCRNYISPGLIDRAGNHGKLVDQIDIKTSAGRIVVPDRPSQISDTGEIALHASEVILKSNEDRPRIAPSGAGINGAMSLFYLGVIAGAELITAAASPIWGVAAHGLLLVCLVLHASLEKDTRFQKFYLALALAPLVRILSLAMPLANFPQIYWYVIVAVPLLLAAVTVMVRLGLYPKDVGLTLNCLPLQLMVGMTGVAFGLVEFYILRPEPLAGSFTWNEVALPAVILFIGTGFTEEFIFRGVMQRAAGEALGGWGWVFIALVFAALHIGYLSIADLGLVFGVGLFFGLVVQKTGSILGTTISHGITNIVLYLVAPFFL